MFFPAFGCSNAPRPEKHSNECEARRSRAGSIVMAVGAKVPDASPIELATAG
jgi:hypothetical protein